jgi:hypothetical protein
LDKSAQCDVASLHLFAIVGAGAIFARLGDSDDVVGIGINEENHVIIAFNAGLTVQRYGGWVRMDACRNIFLQSGN